MNFYTDDSPIIACSTGTTSNTAIAVIRLSGFQTLLSLQFFFSFSLSKIKPRYSHLTNISFENNIFDNGLMVFFPAGESYTGENVLELSVHGNQLNIQKIIDLFIHKGHFRLASPGEFTYRALKNKKLSFSQVEGLDLLLNASSNLMLTQGLDILQGELHAQYLSLYNSFLKLKAAIEISIDFAEDIGEAESNKLFYDSFNIFFKILESLHVRTQGNISSLLSPEIVLVGQTNAGKSSLFNFLVKHNRSIVSSIAGTTRDYISEIINVGGTNFNLIDTAGIRDSLDIIENIGIDRAFTILKRAFFKILIINPFETNSDYLEKLSGVNFDFLIISHSDKPDFFNKISRLDLSKITASRFVIASFETGFIEHICSSLFKIGPIEPLLSDAFKTAGSIEPLLSNAVKFSGPIEPLSSDATKTAGPIEPLLSDAVKFAGPIESLPSGAIKTAGPIEPLLSDAVKTAGPIEPLPLYAAKIIGPIEPYLKNLIVEKFEFETINGPILIERHRECINKLYLTSLPLSCNIELIQDVAVLSSEVNILANHLVELIGIVSPDDVLNSIFANFCIGK